ncbi:MAG: hypothetical protein ABUS79_19395 [Pseudomonadota bacterium]
MMRRIRSTGLLLGAIMLATTGAARALSPTEWKTRRLLIEEMEAAHGANDHAKALSLAQRAAALEMTPSLRFFIAREQDETGAMADAYSNAAQCALEAERDAKLRKRDEIRQACREIEQRLKDRVGHIVVDVPNAPQGLKITLSGQELNQAALGIPYVITPGTTTVEASAPNYSPYRLEISVPEGKTINVSVTLAPTSPRGAAADQPCPAGQQRGSKGECVAAVCQVGMARSADGLHCCWPGQTWDETAARCSGVVACPAGTAARGDGCAPTGEPPRDPVVGGHTLLATGDKGVRDPRSSRRVAALAVAGLGAAAAITGTVVWAVSNSKYDTLKDHCTAGCSRDEYDSGRSTVRTLDRVAAGTWIAGGALAAGGLLYYLWTGRSETGEAMTVSVDPLGGHVAVGGTF